MGRGQSCGGQTSGGDLKVGGEAFITDKPKKGHLISKYTFIALNLAFYCTLSASMLKFQLFINFWPKKIDHIPLDPPFIRPLI